MRSKAPLALMELTIMVLVFALAAALCLRAFTWSDARSIRNEARDQAVLQAESAAEVLKHSQGDFAQASAILGGSWDGSTWTISYDTQWQTTDGPSSYALSVQPEDSGQLYLGQANVEVIDADGASLVQLTVCWQEVSEHD
ncbi:MAG: hypothetical protein AB7E30_09875 [Lawsonibacter sp.]